MLLFIFSLVMYGIVLCFDMSRDGSKVFVASSGPELKVVALDHKRVGEFQPGRWHQFKVKYR